jgi:glycosyltransferase involved in cell wall biosynthesis
VKKIAFLINSFADGGAEKVVKLIVEKLFSEGVDVELIFLENDRILDINPKIKVKYLYNGKLKSSKFKSLMMIFTLAYRLNKYIKENNIYLVQSHLFRASYVNILSKRVFRSNHKVHVVNHSVISRLYKEGISGRINLLLIKFLYPYTDVIQSVTYSVQNDMDKLFHFKPRKIVVYNPFDIKNIKTKSREHIDDFIFHQDINYIICVGRLIKGKRNSDVINALINTPQYVELIFIGDGELLNSLKEDAVAMGMQSRVHFLGWVENPYKYIKNSDVLVSTSESESFGNIIVEAFICKTPVISTICGGPEEIIQNDCGILIEIGDISALRKGILKILADSKFNSCQIINASSRAKMFALENIMDDYKKVILN